MKKQIFKALTMSSLIVTLTLAVAVASASAQSFNHIVVNVPFDFTVGERILQAGKYTIRQISSDSPNVFISSEDGKTTAILLVHSVEARTIPDQAKLVFHRSGNHYFLSEIWTGTSNIGRQLYKSEYEHEIERGLPANP